MRAPVPLRACLALALVLLASGAFAAENDTESDIFIPKFQYIQPIDNKTVEVMVRLPRNRTSRFTCPGTIQSNIIGITGGSVDVLGRTWQELEQYDGWGQIQLCWDTPSCTIFVKPEWWDWEAGCPDCQTCPECERSLRVAYRCPREAALSDANTPSSVSTAPATADSGSSGSTPVGAVVGGVVGGVLAAVACLALWLLHRRRVAAQQESSVVAVAGSGDSSGEQLNSKGSSSAVPELPPMTTRASMLSVNGLRALQDHQRSKTVSGGFLPLFRRPGAGTNGAANRATLPPGNGASPVATAPGAAAFMRAPLARQVSTASAATTATVDIKPWLLPFSDLDLHSRVGDGSYGAVFLAYWHQTEVAVKVLHGAGHDEPLSLSNPLLAGLQAEATTMASLRHPCCVQFLGVCVAPPAIVSEFCARGSLTDVLREARLAPDPAAVLSWSRRLSIAAEAASGMAYLHSRMPPVVHRDLKSPNILIDEDWHAKIADYNLAKVMDGTERDSGTSLAATNPRWLSPEVLHGGSATFASDVYAMGIILWELMTLELPWAGQTNPFQIFKSVTSGHRPPLPPDPSTLAGGTFPCLANYVALLQECWAQQPQQRPTFADITARLREMQDACWSRHTV